MNEIIRRKELVDGVDFNLPIYLLSNEEETSFTINIDGVDWVTLENQIHATVLFWMMKEHLVKDGYYKYEKR